MQKREVNISPTTCPTVYFIFFKETVFEMSVCWSPAMLSGVSHRHVTKYHIGVGVGGMNH